MVRVRLDVAYDGTGFAGWAAQPDHRTVQGELERALATTGGGTPRLVVAGRTDAGVHASGQVAHVDLTAEQLDRVTRRHRGPGDVEHLAERISGVLAEAGDVVVRRSSIAPDGFDARFSAVSRRYRYRIADRLDARDPVDRWRTVRWPRPLDDVLMREAAAAVLGLHDFAAFCKPREGATTIRDLLALDWFREPSGVLVADVRADAFCHGMVRALVGASIAVGLGRIPPRRLGELLTAPGRSSEFAVAPAYGLTLVDVAYPADGDLAAQAERARARRVLRG